MKMRGAKKDEVMFTYVHDYLAPHPWLGEEMNKFKIAIRAMTEVVVQIEKRNPSLYMTLQQRDNHVRVYEEFMIINKWIQDNKGFMAAQKRGVDLVRTDFQLKALVDAYCSQGVTLISE